MLVLLIAVPLVTSLLIFFTGTSLKKINIVNCTGSAILFVLSCISSNMVIWNGNLNSTIMRDFFYLDAFNSLMLLITSFLAMLICFYSIGYMKCEAERKIADIKKIKLFNFMLQLFVFTVILATTTQNLGIMWIAIEATTLATAFLVGFYNTRRSVEAAWKYLIICSVGIAFAMLGIILLYYSSVTSLGKSVAGLNWQYLSDNAAVLQPGLVKLAFIFVLLGFGTKAGLAPMHTWLPDAHSQAPSPMSALLSGVLLNTAIYSVIRIMIIVNKNLGETFFTGRLLIALGLISMGVSAVSIMVQKDYKRILAYSSIEHLGLISLAFGLATPVSVFAALYHTINHSLTKTLLFAAAGNVYLRYETKRTSKVRAIIKVMPLTGIVFLAGLFGIMGMPPFGIFSSEFGVLLAAINSDRYFVAVVVSLSLAMVFAGFAVSMIKMFFGQPEKNYETGEYSKTTSAVLIILVLMTIMMGFYIPGPIHDLIRSARDIITLAG